MMDDAALDDLVQRLEDTHCDTCDLRLTTDLPCSCAHTPAGETITQLRSERDRLREQIAVIQLRAETFERYAEAKDAEIAEGKAVEDCLIVDYQTQYAKAQKAEREAEANRRDALRYRWLRDPPPGLHEEMCIAYNEGVYFGEDADRAIDAAIAQEDQKHG